MLYEENIPILIAVVAVIALANAFVIAKGLQFSRRLAQVRSQAGKIGLHPVEPLDRIWQELCRRQFIMMHFSRDYPWAERFLKNPLEGIIEGYRVVLFDFRFYLKEHAREYQSAVAVVGDDHEFAKFVLFPQKLGSSFSPLRMIKSALARVHDIISGYCRIKDLINGYTLLCPEKSAKLVRSYFNADVLAYFSGHQKCIVEGSGHHLLVFWKRKLIPAEQVESFIDEAIDIRRRFEKAATDGAV
jgi:hypothetical protein